MTEPFEAAGRIDTGESRVAGKPCGPLRVGEQVTVYRLAISRRPFIEGMATILSAFDEAQDLYWVRFAGESVPRMRVIHAGSWQSEPDAILHALLAHWRDANDFEGLAPVLSDDGPMPREGR